MIDPGSWSPDISAPASDASLLLIEYGTLSQDPV